MRRINGPSVLAYALVVAHALVTLHLAVMMRLTQRTNWTTEELFVIFPMSWMVVHNAHEALDAFGQAQGA